MITPTVIMIIIIIHFDISFPFFLVTEGTAANKVKLPCLALPCLHLHPPHQAFLSRPGCGKENGLANALSWR